MNIKITLTKHSKEKDFSDLGFGKIMTDHMFMMDYYDGSWHNPRIEPYHDLSLDPASIVLHYAQETFEGLKAYYGDDGQIRLFRPERNAKRFQNSNERLCIPKIATDDFLEACKAIVKVEKAWIPKKKGCSLYLRPFCIATEKRIGVHPAKEYLFAIICSPVALYSSKGLEPNKLLVEDEYVRAVQGGTGFAKCGGNYAGSLIAEQKAKAHNCDFVLWLDAKERKYVEEVGAMNIFFKIDDYYITAPINGTVLDGVTRNSVIALLKDQGKIVKEEKLAIDELFLLAKQHRVAEVFGTGTAAVIVPFGKMVYRDQEVTIGDNQTGPMSLYLYNTLTGIQYGKIADKFNWVTVVK